MFAGKRLVLLSAAIVTLAFALPARAQYFGDFFAGPEVGPGGELLYQPQDRYGYYRTPRYRRYDRPYRRRAYRAPRASRIPYSYARDGRRRVQRRLNRLGFNAGPEDGVYGRQTRAAMADFQASRGAEP